MHDRLDSKTLPGQEPGTVHPQQGSLQILRLLRSLLSNGVAASGWQTCG